MPAYEPTELPPDDADFGPTHDEITAELLTLTHDFFRQASPATREELRQFLTGRGHHPAADLDTFLDHLGFSARPHGNTDTPPADHDRDQQVGPTLVLKWGQRSLTKSYGRGLPPETGPLGRNSKSWADRESFGAGDRVLHVRSPDSTGTAVSR